MSLKSDLPKLDAALAALPAPALDALRAAVGQIATTFEAIDRMVPPDQTTALQDALKDAGLSLLFKAAMGPARAFDAALTLLPACPTLDSIVGALIRQLTAPEAKR